MRNQQRTLTRRAFGLTALATSAGLATSGGASGQDLETFKALGLDKRPDLSWLGDREAFNRFLQDGPSDGVGA